LAGDAVGLAEEMSDSPPYPPLIELHPKTSLSPAKLAQLERFSTEALMNSLVPGQRDSLKTRVDGTIIDGHHRIHILRERGVDVDALPREIVAKKDL
jgi:hypothetical protein